MTTGRGVLPGTVSRPRDTDTAALRAVRLVIRLARGARWAEVRPLVCAAAGLPADTVLYHGVGPAEEHWPVGAPPLLAGCTLSTRPAAAHPDRPPLVLSVISGPDAGTWAAVGTGPLSAGRRRDADLPLTDPAVSRHHARIGPHPAGLVVTDLGSVNGVLVDGAPAGDGAVATTGSVIRLGDTLLQVQLTTEPPGGFRADGRGHLVRVGRPARFQERLPALPPPPSAPETPPRRSLPLLTALIGAAVGGALALVLHNTMFLAFAALGPVMMIGNALGDRLRGRRSYRRQRADHLAAVANWRQAVARRANAERLARWRRWPGPGELLRRADAMSGRLWDRRRTDADYLHVAAGHGTTPLTGAGVTDAVSGAPAAPASSAGAVRADGAASGGHGAAGSGGHDAPDGAHLAGRIRRLLSWPRRRRSPRRLAHTDDADADRARPLSLSDVPLVIPLAEVPSGVIGFAGPAERAVARFVIAQLACHHSPDDLALAVIGTGAEWEVCHDLPHGIALTAKSTLGGEPATQPASLGTLGGSRDLVVLLDGPGACGSPTGATLLAMAGERTPSPAGDQGRRPRLIVLAVADSAEDLPPQAAPLANVIDVITPLSPTSPTDDCAPAGRSRSAQRVSGYTQVSAPLLTQICRALAPLRDGQAGAASPAAVPGPGDGGVTLADLGDAVPPLTAAGVRERWSRPSARAVLGVTTPARGTLAGIAPTETGADKVTTLDLDDDGPHLLIAGTTGSGKSELLQTLITSLALTAPPTAVTFLLVDYKGGAAFGAIRALPHVVGMLTDLDPGTSARALASLRAELRRREQEQNAGSAPPPKLVLVIDEFATLAAELPEFLTGVLDIAQRGRSLGLHLVLATQRPAGVVSPAMRANISARICLRVTDPTDSLDVLGIPDAAGIPAGQPGRAILRTGRGVTAFRAARVTVPVPPDIVISGGPAGTVTSHPGRPGGAAAGDADPGGAGLSDARAGDTVKPGHDIVTSVVRAMTEAGAGLPRPRRPWLEPLPPRIPSSPERPELLARADLPDEQAQEDLDAPATSVLIVGPPGSGRSTALRRIARIAAHRGEEVLVVDGAGALQDLAGWPEVSSYLTVREPALVLRLLTLLTDPARRPADGRRRHLLIDQYDVVAAELERADYLLGSSLLSELSARAGAGVRISAAGPERLTQQRIASSFPEVITLGSTASPSGRYGPAGVSTPGVPPGRGRWRGLEVQLVDAPRRPDSPATTTSAAPYGDLLAAVAGAFGPPASAPTTSAAPQGAAAPGRHSSSTSARPAPPNVRAPGGRGPAVETSTLAPPEPRNAAVAAGRGPAIGAAKPAPPDTGPHWANAPDPVRPPPPPAPGPWPDALVVRALPALAPAPALPRGGPDRVMIGLGGDDAGPVALDLTREGGAIVVAGPRRSGVTTTLALLARQAAAAGIPVLRVLTRHCRPYPVCTGTPSAVSGDLGAARTGRSDTRGPDSSPERPVIECSDHLTDGPATVVDIPCQESPEPLRAALATHEGPVLVIADHHGLGDDHPAAAVLERFLGVCGPGQHLAIGVRTEVLARARRGHLHAAAACRRGLLLAPDKADGALFDIALPPRRGSVPPGRGVLVWDGTPLPLQVAFPPPTTPAESAEQRPATPAPPVIAPSAGPTPALARTSSMTTGSIPVSACEQGHRTGC